MKKFKGWIDFGILMASWMGMALATNVASGATVTWNNYAGGAWSNPGNWSSGGVPGPGDDAIIALDGTYTVTLDTNVIVNSLTVGSTNGTPTVTLALSNNLTGTFNFGSNAVFNVSSNATLGLSGAINNQGTINWGTTNALTGLGNFTISNSGMFNLMTNFSTTNFSGVCLNSGTIQVPANFGPVTFTPSTMNFTNSGILAAGTNSILVLEASSGNNSNMAFSDGTILNGPGIVQNTNCFLFVNGNITINGTFELDSAATVYGTQVFNGVGTFNWNGGFIGEYTNDYNFYLPIHTNSTTLGSNLVVNIVGTSMNAQIFTNLGTINWLAGDSGALEAEGNLVTFNNCGLFVLQTRLYFEGGSSPHTSFNNYGTISVPANIRTYFNNEDDGWTFTNYGTIDVASNATLTSVFASNSFTLGDGTIINCEGNFEIGPGDSSAYLVADGTITVNGPLESPYGSLGLWNVFISGTQTWTGTGSIGVGGGYGGGGFTGSGTTTFATNFNVYIGNQGVMYLDGHTLNNQGTISVAYDNEFDDLGHAGTFNNYGTIAVQSYLSLGADFSGYEAYTNFGSSFNNYGLIQYGSGGGYLDNHWNFTNSGTISVSSNATLFMDGLNTALSDGTVFAGGGQIELDEGFDINFNFTGNLIANGDIQVNTPVTLGYHVVLQGTETWSGTGSLTWSSGSITQPGTTTISSKLTFIIADDPNDRWGSGNLYVRTLAQNHVLNIQGTALWNSSNPVQMGNQAIIVNNGLVLLEGNGQLQQLTPDCAFNNQPGGIVRAVNGASSFNCPFNNAGLLDFESGSLALGNSFVLEPSAQCQFALSGSAAPFSLPSLNAGGTLIATLPTGVTVTNGSAFPLVSYTDQTGTFPNLQLPPLPPNLQWQLAYGPTALMLEVSHAPPHISAPTKLSNGAFQFTFTGPPGNSYEILTSTNLVNWVPLQTNGAFSGQTNFTDSAATNFPRRFYRAVIGN